MAQTPEKTEKPSKLKLKKKRWFPILAPRFLGQKEVGETYLSEAKAALGRPLKINLRDLTGSFKDQNIYLHLKIKELAGNSLQTELEGYAYLPFFLKKLARKQVGKIEDSFFFETKDNKGVRLKPLATTVFPAKRSAQAALRKKLRQRLEEEGTKLSFEGLFDSLLKNKLQMELKKELSKICPVRDVIIQKAEVEEGPVKAKKKRPEKKEAETEEKELAEKEEDKKEAGKTEEKGKAEKKEKEKTSE